MFLDTWFQVFNKGLRKDDFIGEVRLGSIQELLNKHPVSTEGPVVLEALKLQPAELRSGLKLTPGEDSHA